MAPKVKVNQLLQKVINIYAKKDWRQNATLLDPIVGIKLVRRGTIPLHTELLLRVEIQQSLGQMSWSTTIADLLEQQ